MSVLLLLMVVFVAWLLLAPVKERLSSCALPKGPYSNVCKNCLSDCSQLSCMCTGFDAKTKKVFQKLAKLSLAKCKNKQINSSSGLLSC